MKRGGPLRRRTPLRGFTTRGRATLAEAMLRDARDAALERDNYTCQAPERGLPMCPVESPYGLQVHHILPRGRGGRHELSNLVSLCPHHHRWVHDHPTEAYGLGLLARTEGRNDRRATTSLTVGRSSPRVMELASSDERARGAEAQ